MLSRFSSLLVSSADKPEYTAAAGAISDGQPWQRAGFRKAYCAGPEKRDSLRNGERNGIAAVGASEGCADRVTVGLEHGSCLNVHVIGGAGGLVGLPPAPPARANASRAKVDIPMTRRDVHDQLNSQN